MLMEIFIGADEGSKREGRFGGDINEALCPWPCGLATELSEAARVVRVFGETVTAGGVGSGLWGAAPAAILVTNHY